MSEFHDSQKIYSPNP